MRSSEAIFVIGLAAVLLAGPARIAVAAEEGAASALATWAGQGRLFQTGEKQALFVGAFQGVLFIENGQGILHAARILCPGSMDVDLGTGDQKGEGRCIVTGRSGDRLFARWTCAGPHLRGCNGKFTLTGGTGKFLGITGESEFVVKTVVQEISPGSGPVDIKEAMGGLAVWPELRYRIP
jgi:hypothetical protein